MSVLKGYPASGWYGSGLVKPIKLDMSFVVASANGLGITSLKSNGYVRNVFMHTSITPTSNNGYLNPNPSSGYVAIQMNNNFNAFIGMSSSFVSPTTGSNISISGTSVMTIGKVYVISAVGTSTQANWAAVGLPPGIAPAVGQAFVATVTGTGTGTGTVLAVGISGVDFVEIMGDPNTQVSNQSIATNGGMWIYGQYLASTSSSVTTLIPTAPTNGTIVQLSVFFDGSAVTIDGL